MDTCSRRHGASSQHPTVTMAGEKYFAAFHVRSQHKVSRTQEDYKFLPVVSSTKVMAEEVDKRVKLSTSTKYRTLDEKGSRDETYAEIKKLQDSFDLNDKSLRPYLRNRKRSSLLILSLLSGSMCMIIFLRRRKMPRQRPFSAALRRHR